MKPKSVGSLIQLIATGPQDVHIHEKNNSFMFQNEYKQHTAFGFEHHDMSIDSKFSTTHLIEIPHKGDLLQNIVLKIKIPKLLNNQKYYGVVYNRLLKRIQLFIDDTILLDYDGTFLHLMYSLCLKEFKMDGINAMTDSQSTDSYHLLKSEKTMYIPLILWDLFSQFSYIPMTAMKFQKIKLMIELSSIDDLYIPHPMETKQNIVSSLNIRNNKVKLQLKVNTNPGLYEKNIDVSVLTDFVLLNSQERHLLINSKQSHPYIQVVMQKELLNFNKNKILIHFNIPIQQLIWIISDDENPNVLDLKEFTEARLLLGKDSDLDATYFESNYYKFIQNHYHSERVPSINIYSYSFALRPLYGHPSGMVDFGKLKYKLLEINGNIKGKYITIYGHGMNVLETNNGLSSLKRSLK